MDNVEAHTTRILGSIPASEVKSSAAHFLPNDVLYGRLRPYLNKVAKPDFEGLASAEFIVLPDQKHLRSDFLRFRLNARDFVNFSSRLNAGDRPRVDFEQIGEFEIGLPPATEQVRIIRKVDELFSDLDASVAALERARAKLKRYRAAVLKAAVEGRLTAEWRKTHPPAETASQLLERILAERRKKWEQAQLGKFAAAGKAPPKNWKDKYPEPAKPDAANLPELPEGWRWATVEQLVLRSEYGTSVKCGYDGRYVPVLRIPNVANGRIDLSDLKFSLTKLDFESGDELVPGDLLTCRTNGSIRLVGKSAVVREPLDRAYSFASYLLRFRFVDAANIPFWVHFFLASQKGRAFIESKAASSAGQHNISLSTLHGMPIPLPPINEQKQIAVQADEKLSVIEKAGEGVERQLVHTSRLRQSILKRAFEGRLVPQDPNDEPASALLERIRATRADAPKAAARRGRKRAAAGG